MSSQNIKRRHFIQSAALGGAAVAGLGFTRPGLAQTDSSEWVTLTAKLVLNPDKADAAIHGLQDLVAAVEANEPGVLAYICNRGIEDPNEILFFEIYENQEAGRVHGKAPHMADFGRRAAEGEFFTEPTRLTFYERLAGYYR